MRGAVQEMNAGEESSRGIPESNPGEESKEVLGRNPGEESRRGVQEQPGAASQQPGAARSSQEQPGAGFVDGSLKCGVH